MKNKNGNNGKNGKPRQLAKEVFIDVTEEDYRRMQAKGIQEDALLKPGRHRFVRGLNPLIRAGLLPATPPKKVRVSLLIDEDIIEHFKRRAAELNALPFHTQINSELRNVVLEDLGVTVEVVDENAALLNNQAFIQAVARSVKEQLAQEPKRRKRA